MQSSNQMQQRSRFRESLSIDERLYLLKISKSYNRGFAKSHIERLEKIVEDSILWPVNVNFVDMNKLLLKNSLQNWKKDVYHKDIYIKLTCKNNKCSIHDDLNLFTVELVLKSTNVIDETYKERPEWAFLHRSNN